MQVEFVLHIIHYSFAGGDGGRGGGAGIDLSESALLLAYRTVPVASVEAMGARVPDFSTSLISS